MLYNNSDKIILILKNMKKKKQINIIWMPDSDENYSTKDNNNI